MPRSSMARDCAMNNISKRLSLPCGLIQERTVGALTCALAAVPHRETDSGGGERSSDGDTLDERCAGGGMLRSQDESLLAKTSRVIHDSTGLGSALSAELDLLLGVLSAELGLLLGALSVELHS